MDTLPTMPQEAPPPDTLMDLLLGDVSVPLLKLPILRAGLELQVWAKIAAGHRTANQIASALGADPGGMRRLLDALTVMELLHKEAAVYRLPDWAEHYLLPDRPTYLGDFLLNWLAWEGHGQLAEAIRTGKHPITSDVTREQSVGRFIPYYACRTLAPQLCLQRYDGYWQSLQVEPREGLRVLDLACGAGVAALALAKQHPVPLVLFLWLQGRSYYLAPAYPMLLAAGSVFGERWLNSLKAESAQLVRRITWGALAIGGAVAALLVLPIAPVNSGLWHLANEVHDNFVEQIGWPELVEAIADIYTGLPGDEQALTGILTINYGEAGAVNLYGPAYGLPEAISGMNSYWWRGYGNPPPQTLIVVGYSRDTATQFFESCELAGQTTNRYGVENEETTYFSNIFVCRGLRDTWPEFWKDFQDFG